MIRQCFILKTGILFHKELLKWAGLDPNMLCPDVKLRPPPVTEFSGSRPPEDRDPPGLDENGNYKEITDFVNEEEEDLADAIGEPLDMLKKCKAWWILEYIPQHINLLQKDNNSWVRKLAINRGRGRGIPKQKSDGVKIHRTVELRKKFTIKGEKEKYRPRAKLFDDAKITWVE